MNFLPGWRGRVCYLRTGGPSTEVWGWENWTIRKGDDGLRTLTADCVMDLDGREVIRHVVQGMDPGFHPHDVIVHLTVDRRFYGSAWYRFSDLEAVCEGYSIVDGSVTLSRVISRSMRGFGTHPLQGDAWLMARLDFDAGGVQSFTENLLTSSHHLGATGPAFATSDSAIEIIGRETVTVAAGTFECWHLRYVAMSYDHPPYDLWVTADGEFHFVLGIVGGYFRSRFELTELKLLTETSP